MLLLKVAFFFNRYTVDMAMGICTCGRGQDGNSCKHQYVIWCSRKSECSNFPPLSRRSRKHLAFIAIGASFPEKAYQPMRDYLGEADDNRYDDDLSTTVFVPANSSTVTSTNIDENEDETLQLSSLKAKAKARLKASFNILLNKLESSDDPKLSQGVIKMTEKIEKMCSSDSGTKLISAMFEFGQAQDLKKKMGRKIKVQPAACIRRVSGSGSRQALVKGGRVKPLTRVVEVRKRQHSLAKNVQANENPPKKSGSRIMRSRMRKLCYPDTSEQN